MAEHNETGKKGEEIAVNFLKKKGYKILETNWRLGKNEIDVIALDGKFVVIAEVKTRQSNQFGEPEIAVTREKQKALIRSANAYVRMKHLDLEVRFDIISIILDKDVEKVNHIEDAFYPLIK
jgi:putative endonuclease